MESGTFANPFGNLLFKPDKNLSADKPLGE